MPIIVIARQSENRQLNAAIKVQAAFLSPQSPFCCFFIYFHEFRQAKSSLHSKQKYMLMKTLYKLLYKKYILKINHEKTGKGNIFLVSD